MDPLVIIFFDGFVSSRPIGKKGEDIEESCDRQWSENPSGKIHGGFKRNPRL
jgi:hypothetical protein